MPDTWITPRIWTVGERVGQSKINEISNNLRSLYPYTTGGDLAYRSAAGDYLARLALVVGGVLFGDANGPAYTPAGTQYQFLMSNGANDPDFAALIHRRQGGSATVWETTGTTNYTPTIAIMQVGSRPISYISGVGSVAVTYPVAFSQRPIVLAIANSSTPDIIVNYSDNTTTGCNLRARNVAGGSGSVDVVWLAIGA